MVLVYLLVYHLQDFFNHIIWLHIWGDHEPQSVWFILLCSVAYFIDSLAHFYSGLLPFVSLLHPLYLVVQGHVQHHCLQIGTQLGSDIVPDLSVNESRGYRPIAPHTLSFIENILAQLLVARFHDAEVPPLALCHLDLNLLISCSPQVPPHLCTFANKFLLVHCGKGGVLNVRVDVGVLHHEEAIALVVNIAMVSTENLCCGGLAQSRWSSDPKQLSLPLRFQLVVAHRGIDGVAVIGDPLGLLSSDPLQVPYSHHGLDRELLPILRQHPMLHQVHAEGAVLDLDVRVLLPCRLRHLLVCFSKGSMTEGHDYIWILIVSHRVSLDEHSLKIACALVVALQPREISAGHVAPASTTPHAFLTKTPASC